MRLEAASPSPPPGLGELLADLGDGENGFMGTPVHGGEASLDEFLRQCCEQTDAESLPEGWVPQTVFWLLDDDGQAVGMVRMRHCLNDALLLHGGHIGFYVRTDRRGRGHATQALIATLERLHALGEPRALMTVDADNAASIRVIESVGGYRDPDDDRADSAECRYWVNLPVVLPHAQQADQADSQTRRRPDGRPSRSQLIRGALGPAGERWSWRHTRRSAGIWNVVQRWAA